MYKFKDFTISHIKSGWCDICNKHKNILEIRYECDIGWHGFIDESIDICKVCFVEKLESEEDTNG
jgi:hypothetical protein